MYTNQSQDSITVGLQYQGLMGLVLFSLMSAVPCVVFLFINGTLLFTLRSKPVFCETSRYILLYNLLFADTINLALGQLMYLIATCRIRLTYPVCGVLSLFGNLTTVISPLTLVVMSLERYVAVCYPLMHATVVMIKNTGMAIILVWTLSLLGVLVRGFLLLNFPFEELDSLLMTDFCSAVAMLLGPLADGYDKASTYFLFVSAGVTVIYSYIGVMVAARSASTDKASARKARNTLLLHLMQLGLSLSSTVYNPLITAISKFLDRLVSVRIGVVLYVCIIIFPRCLSALIYGIRDQTIRPVLMYHLCCQWKHLPSLSEVSAKAKISILITS